METIVVGSLGRVAYLHLEPGEDVLAGITNGIAELGMVAGVVLAVTGAVSNTRLSLAVDVNASVEDPPGFVEHAGTAEVDGCGYFGRTQDSWSSEVSQIRYESGMPFVRVHMTAALADRTVAGHLIEGCRVRSVHPSSHFIVVVAEVDGVDLVYRRGGKAMPGYPMGAPFYELRQTSAGDGFPSQCSSGAVEPGQQHFLGQWSFVREEAV